MTRDWRTRVDWRTRLWVSIFLSVLLGLAMAVLVVTAHHYGGVPVVDSTIVWEWER